MRAQHTVTHINTTGSLANSPINIAQLDKVLNEYASINAIVAEELRSGFKNGFKLGYLGPRVLQKSKNLISVAENMDEVMKKIAGEVEKGRVAGPFDNIPFTNLRCSPIGLVPKKNPGEFKLIHHLSWPEGNSVNHHIDPTMASVKYASFDDAIILIQSAGKNCELAKCDIKSALDSYQYILMSIA